MEATLVVGIIQILTLQILKFFLSKKRKKIAYYQLFSLTSTPMMCLNLSTEAAQAQKRQYERLRRHPKVRAAPDAEVMSMRLNKCQPEAGYVLLFSICILAFIYECLILLLRYLVILQEKENIALNTMTFQVDFTHCYNCIGSTY